MDIQTYASDVYNGAVLTIDPATAGVLPTSPQASRENSQARDRNSSTSEQVWTYLQGGSGTRAFLRQRLVVQERILLAEAALVQSAC